MTIIEAVTPKAKRAGRGISPPEVYAYFVEQCRANLHMVLAMSPVGDAFRSVLRLFATVLLAPCRSAAFGTTDACTLCIPDKESSNVSWLVRPACAYHLPAQSPSLFFLGHKFRLWKASSVTQARDLSPSSLTSLISHLVAPADHPHCVQASCVSAYNDLVLLVHADRTRSSFVCKGLGS